MRRAPFLPPHFSRAHLRNQPTPSRLTNAWRQTFAGSARSRADADTAAGRPVTTAVTTAVAGSGPGPSDDAPGASAFPSTPPSPPDPRARLYRGKLRAAAHLTTSPEPRRAANAPARTYSPRLPGLLPATGGRGAAGGAPLPEGGSRRSSRRRAPRRWPKWGGGGRQRRLLTASARAVGVTASRLAVPAAGQRWTRVPTRTLCLSPRVRGCRVPDARSFFDVMAAACVGWEGAEATTVWATGGMAETTQADRRD